MHSKTRGNQAANVGEGGKLIANEMYDDEVNVNEVCMCQCSCWKVHKRV